MTALYFLLEQVLFLFASWTLGYHLVLALRLPAVSVFLPAIALYAVFFVTLGTRPHRALRSALVEPAFVSSVMLLGLACAALTLFFYRPDADDISFFHRALVALDDVYAPFTLEHTQHNVSGLPAISIMHVMTSYEPLAALVGKGLTGNPLWFYQNFTAACAAFLLPAVYALAFRFFRLRPAHSVAAAAVAIVFLLLDGGVHRSFGNEGLVRLWQGKTILITIGIPLLLLLSLRFLARPSLRRFAAVFLAGVSAVGLSGSSLFLVPLAVFAVSAAYIFGFGARPRRLRKAFILNLASAYCAAIVGMLLVGILEEPAVQLVWRAFWPRTWAANLMLVLEGPRVIVRDAILLFIVPAMLLGPLVRRYVVVFCLILVFLFANPIAGPHMMRLLTPGAYWRLCYLLPLPLCFGLIVSGFTTRRLSPLSLVRMIVSVVAVLSVFWSLSATVFHQAYTKSPSELKFFPREYEFVRAAMPEIRPGSVVLAPEEIVCVLALVRPDLRFEAARPLETTHVFRCAGKSVEGKARIMAQRLLSEREPTPQSAPAFLKVLDDRVDYIFARSPNFPYARRLLDERGVAFSVMRADNWYTFVSLGPPSPAPPGPR